MSVQAIFIVSLSKASTKTVSVAYATADGTAVAGTDYEATSGTLTFGPGVTSQQVSVTVYDRLADAPDVYFSLDVTDPVNATFQKDAGKCTVTVATADSYAARFRRIYALMMDRNTGYWGPPTGPKAFTMPYHCIEDLIVEAPDWGHESVSETVSFLSKLTAWNGILNGDATDYKKSWDCIEANYIPSATNQPWGQYTANAPAQYVPDAATLQDTPLAPGTDITVGADPLYNALKTTYGSSALYLMHWLIDVDGVYGFKNGDGSSQGAFINNYQRGPVEDGWATITHHCWEDFTNGGAASAGFLPIYGRSLPNYQDGVGTYAKQWGYSVAPDAESRSIIASYLIAEATADTTLAPYSAKAMKMADYQRYAFYDKYFHGIPGYDGSGCHYLLSWGCGFGGAIPDTSGQSSWGFRIGNSEIHHGYNCVDVAYICSPSSGKGWAPQTTGAGQMYETSLSRQLELIRWLQSPEGPMAGGVSSNYQGVYATPTDGRQTAKFYGLYYIYSPSWHNPPSNNWVGYQSWSVERIARLYRMVAGSSTAFDTDIATKCGVILDHWMNWFFANTTVTTSKVTMPATLSWVSNAAIAGQTASAPNAEGTYEYLPTLNWDSMGDYGAFWDASAVPNPNLHCTISEMGLDIGSAAAACQAIVQYCKAKQTITGNLDGVIPSGTAKYSDLLALAVNMLDALWHNYQDPQGFSASESMAGYTRLNDVLWIPPEFGTGAMPNGDVLANGQTTYVGMRSFYKTSAKWPELEAYLAGGDAPSTNYHRFWQNAELAISMGMMSHYFPTQAAS